MKLVYAAALAALIPCAAMASGLRPGLYTINGGQEICLQSAGTWTSPTFSGWGGQWQVANNNTHIFGNYASGAGNDSIVVKGKHASWTEWRDDLSYVFEGDPVSFLHTGSCTAAAKSAPNAHANPGQR